MGCDILPKTGTATIARSILAIPYADHQQLEKLLEGSEYDTNTARNQIAWSEDGLRVNIWDQKYF